ncbi:hypothetical protein Q5M85_15580 [Paraclostridium bifermentans]|nr:hypothetical protein [Paraclostridium bifermentans]
MDINKENIDKVGYLDDNFKIFHIKDMRDISLTIITMTLIKLQF